MKPFRDSTDLVGDADALKSRFATEGYLFLRGIADRTRLTELRGRIIGVLQAHGWLDPGTDPEAAIPQVLPYYEGEDEYLEVLRDIQRLEAFHALPHTPELLGCMQALLGDTAFPHPLGITRLIFPDNPETATPPHQDYPNNQGTEDLYTCWIPLADCPMENGSLAILEGSHRFGLLPTEFALGPGFRQAALDARLDGLEWAASDFALGDILIFHSLTVHRSLENLAPSMRLSVDYRYQREGEALTFQCLRPHFQIQDWKTIYRHEKWHDKSLHHYWKRKSYQVVRWDKELHATTAESAAEQGRRWAEYDRLRRERHAKS